MTKVEIEYFISKNKITSMKELIVRLRAEDIKMNREEIVGIIACEQIENIINTLGDDFAYDTKKVAKVLKTFKSSTAQRRKDDLRKGIKVRTPHPVSLEKNVKAYYSKVEIAAVLYLQSHASMKFGQASLSHILETRHD